MSDPLAASPSPSFADLRRAYAEGRLRHLTIDRQFYMQYRDGNRDAGFAKEKIFFAEAAAFDEKAAVLNVKRVNTMFDTNPNVAAWWYDDPDNEVKKIFYNKKNLTISQVKRNDDDQEIAIDPAYDVYEDETFYIKQASSAFHDDDLADELRRQSVDTIVITGAYTEACVQLSVDQALEKGFKVIVLADLVRPLNKYEESIDTDWRTAYNKNYFDTEKALFSEMRFKDHPNFIVMTSEEFLQQIGLEYALTNKAAAFAQNKTSQIPITSTRIVSPSLI